VPLGPTLLSVLREWKLACPNGKHDLVFPTPSSGIALHNNVVRALRAAVRAAGLTNAKGEPKYTGPHALRHFFASWCINPLDRGGQGLPPKVVQHQLGQLNHCDDDGHLWSSVSR
jgi:integrase